MEPHWGNWGSVSGCSKTCGFGTEERTRYLIVGGVVNHEKKETQIYQCYLTNCPGKNIRLQIPYSTSQIYVYACMCTCSYICMTTLSNVSASN